MIDILPKLVKFLQNFVCTIKISWHCFSFFSFLCNLKVFLSTLLISIIVFPILVSEDTVSSSSTFMWMHSLPHCLRLFLSRNFCLVFFVKGSPGGLLNATPLTPQSTQNSLPLSSNSNQTSSQLQVLLLMKALNICYSF